MSLHPGKYPLDLGGGNMIYYACSFGSAGVAQWQSSSLPSWLRGFDSLRPLQTGQGQGGVMAAAADSKSAIREYVRVRVPLLAPAAAPCGASVGRSNAGRRTKRLEGCPSGRWCNLGKVVWGQLHRGFESPPFRQYWRKASLRTMRQPRGSASALSC